MNQKNKSLGFIVSLWEIARNFNIKLYTFIEQFDLCVKVATSFGSRSFSVAAPKIWNSLPPALRMCTSHDTFRHQLKTHYSSWPSNPLSASSLAPQIRFGWPLCAFTNYIYLLTYLLTYNSKFAILFGLETFNKWIKFHTKILSHLWEKAETLQDTVFCMLVCNISQQNFVD